MLPSAQNAGLSAAAPVVLLVIVATQISRPSKLLPIERIAASVGNACAYSNSSLVSSSCL